MLGTTLARIVPQSLGIRPIPAGRGPVRVGEVHMLQNNGDVPMKVACFFAPATNLDNYKFFEDVEFPK